MKIQKAIANSGYCSRRKAEKLIKERKVRVNKKIATVGMHIDSNDKITVEGKTINIKEEKIYIALNKPRDYVCTNKESDDEKNVFSLLNVKNRLFVVGRLDKDSRGLVLLTNDGDFAYKMTHPSFSHEKEYRVSLSREIDEKIKEGLIFGVDINESTLVKAKEIEKIGPKKYKVVLTQGKRRQIRRMFEVFNRTVLDLQRVRIGKYKMGRLKEKEWEFIEK